MDTRASVGSMTMEPPEGSFTSRWKAVSIWLSIWKRLNSGTLSSYSLILLAYCGITCWMKLSASSCALDAVDQHFADVLAQVVADGANDDVGFLIDQEWRGAILGGVFHRGPELQQVVEIALQFFRLSDPDRLCVR